MAGKPRSIDAPAPPWRLMPPRDNTDEVSQEPPPAAAATEPAAPSVDKAALARQLAEKAKAGAAEKRAAEEAAAKAKAQKADLARQLVEQAKAAHAKGATPGTAPVRAPAKTATPKPAPAAKAPPRPVEPAPAAKATPPPAEELSASARTPQTRKLSAQEALAAAIAAESDAPAKPTKPTAKSPAAAAPPAAAPQAATPAGAPPVVRAILEALPGAQVDAPVAVTKVPVFTAVWKAHRSRAQRAGDVALVVTATQLLAAIERGAVLAARVSVSGASWAVFVDDAGRVVGAALPADTYLQGL